MGEVAKDRAAPDRLEHGFDAAGLASITHDTAAGCLESPANHSGVGCGKFKIAAKRASFHLKDDTTAILNFPHPTP
jgi:hypothetical protein